MSAGLEVPCPAQVDQVCHDTQVGASGAWLLSPTVVFDHRIEYVRWDNTPATALSGLASDNVRRVVQSVSAKHFTSTGEDTMEYAVYMQHVLRPIT